MSTTDLDLAYVREVGEDVRSRLFPRPKRVLDERGEEVDGPVPVPLPVSLRYRPRVEVDLEVLFVPERWVQRVGPVDLKAPEVPPSRVRVVVGGGYQEIESLTLDLEFGKEPKLPEPDSPAGVAVASLLRAIAGTL